MFPQAGILIQARRRPPDTGLRTNNENLIINTLLKLKSAGTAESAIKRISYNLTYLAKLTDLTNPEQIKTTIANLTKKGTNQPVANSYKANLVKSYNYLILLNQMEWNRPKYTTESKTPLISTTNNVMKIISASSKKYTTISTILAETGLEGHELATVSRKYIDQEQGIISAQGCKDTNQDNSK
jgi:hypothetical protein